MLANATETERTFLIPAGLDPGRLMMTPLLVRVLALIAVMLLAQLT